MYSDIKIDLSKLDTSKFQKYIEAEFEAAALEAESFAKIAAPSDLGTHRNLIKGEAYKTPTGVEMSLRAGSDYAAYLEFGTGVFAASYVSGLSPDLQAYAMSFFVSGKGRLPARPHVVPAFQKAVKNLIDHLKAYRNE